MKKLNVCIAGLGSVGGIRDAELDKPGTDKILTHCHAAYKAREKGFVDKIYGVDVDREKLKKAKEKWNIETFKSFNSIKDRIHILIISVPTINHYDVAVEGVVDLHPDITIIEKPFCDSLLNAEIISSVCKQNKSKILINYARNFSQDIMNILSTIKKGEYGEIQNVKLTYTRGLKRDASHGIDMINKFCGEFIHGELLGSRACAYADFSEHDLTVPAYLSYEKCNNVFLIPADGRIGSVFDLDILTEKGRLLFTEHFRIFEFYPFLKEKIYGNFLSLTPHATAVKKIKIENTIYESLLNAIQYCFDKSTKILCTDADAIKVHKVIKNITENRR